MRHDYHQDFEEWHERDLRDMVLRARNHPSVMMYSIGNEIREQFDSTGTTIARRLTEIVKSLDATRPVTCALTENEPEKNYIYQSGALDVLSFNYKHRDYADFPNRFPGEPIIASENMSAFATRGVYNQPSDSIRIWPEAHNVPIKDPNPDFTCSAYDHVHAYWGATHEDTWKTVKKLDFVSGMFIWSGFDFIGEPDPYKWPARSSYYGVIDLAGFPKDAYYFYQSEWTDKTMLHLFPHWNWIEGETIDVVAYYNNADEVELFLNGKSMGVQNKNEDKLHVMWRLAYEPGTIKAVSRKNGQTVMEREIHTAGKAATIELVADRSEITADGYDLSFITVRILDEQGNLVPDADHMVTFNIKGNGFIAGTDNGYQASHESFKTKQRKAWKGMCLAIVQSNGKSGEIVLEAKADGLKAATVKINARGK
jgi:beta-galactosidase